MGIIILIIIVAVLGCALALMAPVLIFGELSFNGPPAMIGGVRFLFVKQHFGKRKPKDKPGAGPARENGSGETPSMAQIRLILREHLVIRQLVALFADSVKKVLVLPERYFIDVDLTGGFQSPDITGQVYGLVQVGRSIPSGALSLAYDPDFTSNRIQGAITIGSALRAYKLIILLIIIAWRLPKIKLIKIYRKFKKGGQSCLKT